MPPDTQTHFETPNKVASQPPRSYDFLITLVIIMFLSGGYATWFFLNPPPEFEPEYSATVSHSNKFADWKTYRNEEYGFEIKIPTSWRTDIQKGVVYLFYSPTKEIQELTFVVLNPEVTITYPPKLNLRKIKMNGLDWSRYEDYEGNISYEYQNSTGILNFSSKNSSLLEEILSTFKFTK